MRNPERLVFNGLNGDTGGYLLPPMTPEELSRLVRGESYNPEHLQELKWRDRQRTQSTFALKEGADPKRLDAAGWGVVFSENADPAVREALGELLRLRQEQAGQLFKELACKPDESKNAFLVRHGSGPGPVDPRKIPYYLLLVGDPETISFRFQYELDVQHAVGRLWFETPEEYARYARSVVMAETGRVSLPRRAAFFAAQNPGDAATELGSRELAAPLAAWMGQDQPLWKVETVLAEHATKHRLGELLGGVDTPAFLFTASHGMGFENGSPRQIPHQGALLCQDWPGPDQWRKEIPQDFYFAADDVPSDARLLGLTVFLFACYGAGTPRLDDFAQGGPRAIAPRAFLSRLPQRLLGHPGGGALAVVGHVERAWGCSFIWERAGRQLAVFEATLKRLLEGHPMGSALEYFNERYAELATILSGELDDARKGKQVDPYLLCDFWTAHNDARGYAVFGDPAVRIPPAGPGGERPALDPTGLPGFVSAPPPSPSPPVSGEESARREEAAAVEFGLLDPLRQARDQLTGALTAFADRLGTLLRETVDDLSSLEVKTYVSDDLEAVTYEKGSFTGAARLRALTRLSFDGDALVCVPERDGEIDDALWAIHMGMVERAQAQRTAMLETAVSAAAGLLNALKGL